MKWIAAAALAALGVAAATAVGASGSSRPVRPNAITGLAAGKLDPVINTGEQAVLKALSEGIATVFKKAGPGGSPAFQKQQGAWNRVKSDFNTGENKFINSTKNASDQFLNGVTSGGDLGTDLIKLLRLLSGYQQSVSNSAAKWAQVPNTPSWDLTTVAKSASANGTGGKNTVANALQGSTKLIQTVARAEVTLYESVAIAEIEYEGGILTPREAIDQIDSALAAFEKAIGGAAGSVLHGAPSGWNQVVNKTETPSNTNWNQTMNTQGYNIMTLVQQAPAPGPTTTVTQTTTPPTVAVQCPVATGDYGWSPPFTLNVTGSVSPAVGGATVTIAYDSNYPDGGTTHTVTTAANGTFTDSFTDTDSRQGSITIQATYGGSNSNACTEYSFGTGG